MIELKTIGKIANNPKSKFLRIKKELASTIEGKRMIVWK